jgi:hypothetical protein
MQFVKKVANMYDLTHPKRPAYPSKVDLERLGIHGQGKRWEI